MVDEQYAEQDVYVDMISRLRGLEGQYNLLRDRLLVINQNLILQHKKLSGNINIVDEDLKKMKSELFEITETLRYVVKELGQYASKGDIRVLEKYINLWNPMKFVTEEEVIELIKKHKKRG
ncbi:MAG TPA: hypothetical protein VJB89_02135 [Candidatus Nanoarchaeia archaeon]|nr:hypothetical protein [Candidatus Nanoarchaeia archaeon]